MPGLFEMSGLFKMTCTKTRIRGVTAALSLSLCGAAFAQTPVPLDNPGFESGSAGWALWTQSGSLAVAAVTYPDTGARTGTRYARVEVTAAAESSGENWHVQFQPPTNWEAVAGATYEFKFWAKSDVELPLHVSVQGSDYTYLTGTSFGLTPEWTEYSVMHTAEEAGQGAVRFHVYVAEAVGVYSFDDFSLTETLPAGVRSADKAQGFQIRQVAGNLVLSLPAGQVGTWKAELVNLRGSRLAMTQGHVDASLRFALPKEKGAYFVRVSGPKGSWVRKIAVQ